MTERHPIYSAQAAGQQIGYIEDDEAFDLFDRPCAIYDSNTSLLRDPKNNAVVGYVRRFARVTAHVLSPEEALLPAQLMRSNPRARRAVGSLADADTAKCHGWNEAVIGRTVRREFSNWYSERASR
jgi:hypothetical protein